MKRVNNLYSNIYKFNNIKSMYKVIRCTSKNKNEIIEFEKALNSNLVRIMNLLYSNKYIFDRYNIFIISEPKYRLIMSENISDKLVNHLVCKYCLLPLEKCLIDGNVATRKNKGSNYAFKLMKKYINSFNRFEEIYVLKIDIKKYFYNIDHSILKGMLESKIKDKNALKIVYKIIDSTNDKYINIYIKNIKEKICTCLKDNNIISEVKSIPYYNYNKGLPIGNMTSQFLAIFYLNDLDHYIKEVLNIKCYIRYMDDLVLISNDKSKLKQCFKIIKEELNKIGLVTNKKSKLYSLNKGFSFLGYKYINNKIMYSNNTYRRIIKKLNYLYNNDYKKYYKSIRSYKGYFDRVYNKRIVGEKNMYDKYLNIKRDNLDSVVIIKKGIFYYCYGDDALIIGHFFNYKIVNNKVGFPEKSINKVKYKFVCESINFIICIGNELYINNSNFNKYNNALEKSIKECDINNKILLLNSKIKSIIECNSSMYSVINDYLDNNLL